MARQKREKIGNFLLPNAPTYIVACDSAKAKVFLSTSRFGEWTEVTTLDSPDAALREQERVSDRPGRVFDSFGKGRHAMAVEETGRQHEMHRFANEVAGLLNKALAEGEFTQLVLISEPAFLGYLRRALSPAASRSISCAVSKNLADQDMQRIKALFE